MMIASVFIASMFILPSFFSPSCLNNLVEMMQMNDNEPNHVLVKKIVVINATHFRLKFYVLSEISHDNDISDGD